MERINPVLTDERFGEIVAQILASREAAAEASRMADAYEENATAAASELTGKAESLTELRERRIRSTAVAEAARGEAEVARARKREADAATAAAVRDLREEGMPEGEWVRHGDLGVYLWPRSEAREEAGEIALYPWNTVERAPAGATPDTISKVVEIGETDRFIGWCLALLAAGALVALGTWFGVNGVWGWAHDQGFWVSVAQVVGALVICVSGLGSGAALLLTFMTLEYRGTQKNALESTISGGGG